MQNQYNR